jgi:hypothetical protein
MWAVHHVVAISVSPRLISIPCDSRPNTTSTSSSIPSSPL